MSFTVRERLLRGYAGRADAPATTAAPDVETSVPEASPDGLPDLASLAAAATRAAVHVESVADAMEQAVDAPDAGATRVGFVGSGATFERLAPTASRTSGTSGATPRRAEGELTGVEQLKADLHRRLIDRLDLSALERVRDEEQLTEQVRRAVSEFLRAEQTPLSQVEREQIVEQVVHEIVGLGPIEPLFRDPTISDILVNGAHHVWIESGGRLRRAPVRFRDDAHLMAVIDRIVSRVGRRIDESSPMVDARLPDGSRVNAVIPPLALDGPVLSIRRFGAGLTAQQLVKAGALTDHIMFMLAACVRSKMNVVVSGGTGSGKTTLLNALSSFIPDHERIVTIEDAAELRLQQAHVVRLETRPSNAEGRGEITARDLVKNALRMRPDRIIVGETRSGEALDMLQAMNTGHEGSMTTVHANTPRDAIARMETMVLFAGTQLPMRAIREQIASAVSLIVQVSRQSDGTRRVMSVTEVTGMEGEILTTQEIFRFRREGVAADGEVLGRYEATGLRPTFADRLKAAGLELPASLFELR
ncbi:MAG: CpaF family protein [Gemmatirosa sp.]